MANLEQRGYSTNFQEAGAQKSVIKTLQYPEDIGDEYGTTSHYMILFINELSNSTWLKERIGKISTESPEIERSTTSGGYHLRTEVIPAVKSGSVTAANLVSSGTKYFRKPSTKEADEKENEEAITSFLNEQTPSYKRTKAVIALPLPELINNTYAADWVAASTTSVVSNLGSMANENTSFAKQVKKVAVNRLATGFLGEGATGSITKSMVNPKRELIFQGNLPRGFSFQWTLYARTPNEAKAIWDIIQMLKFHMLPEYDEETGGMFVKFPSTFDLEFYSHGERNDWLFKTTTVALTNLDINYTPAGTTAFLKKPLLSDNDLKNFPRGAPPIGVSISTNFMELETLYKNKIDPDNDFRFNQKPSVTGGTY